MTPAPYQPSWRRTAAAFAILALIALWAAVVVQFAEPIGRLPVLLQGLVYVALGIGWIWVLPLRRILAWGETGRWRAPGDDPNRKRR